MDYYVRFARESSKEVSVSLQNAEWNNKLKNMIADNNKSCYEASLPVVVCHSHTFLTPDAQVFVFDEDWSLFF